MTLAARLQGLTKEHDVALLMNEVTEAGAEGRFRTRGLGTVRVRGRAAPTTLFTVDDPAVVADAPTERIDVSGEISAARRKATLS